MTYTCIYLCIIYVCVIETLHRPSLQTQFQMSYSATLLSQSDPPKFYASQKGSATKAAAVWEIYLDLQSTQNNSLYPKTKAVWSIYVGHFLGPARQIHHPRKSPPGL